LDGVTRSRRYSIPGVSHAAGKIAQAPISKQLHLCIKLELGKLKLAAGRMQRTKRKPQGDGPYRSMVNISTVLAMQVGARVEDLNVCNGQTRKNSV
jgi:hypothetical protein